MIPDIREINFPETEEGVKYATLSHAECNIQDMADKTITTQVRIDGQIAPDFSYDWEVEFKGEKYIMPLRQPQGAKENTALNSTIDLTFQHWAIYKLKGKYFFTVLPEDVGAIVPDKYTATVALNLKDFCDLCGKVLNFYYGDKITIDFNDPDKNPDGWEYNREAIKVEINHSYVWDVIIKLYELYAVRWQIEPNGDIDHYVIKVGYSTTSIGHIFEYGFEGGLMRVERQIQDDNIRNVIIGRGGSKNLPYRYFKDVDPQNESFPADPDWIPELADMPFTEIYGATFRSYIQGWKQSHYGGASVTEASKAYAPWAWQRGYTDGTFRPVDFVADEFTTENNGYGVNPDSSIAKYGELMGGLENNEEIYPSIQGVTINGYGRIDQIVAVQPVEDVNVADDAEQKAQTAPLGAAKGDTKLTAKELAAISSRQVEVVATCGETFMVLDGMTANLLPVNPQAAVCYDYNGSHRVQLDESEFELIEPVTAQVRDANSGEVLSSTVGIPPGTYNYSVRAYIRFKPDTPHGGATYTFSFGCAGATLQSAYVREYNEKNTFNVWIKNVWQTTKLQAETEAQYIDRVWKPILGDKEGSEAKLVFTSGRLAISQDYEFTIIKGGIHYDTSESIGGVPSYWRLTLAKSEAEAETTGLYVPSSTQQASAGDYFVFTGIDIPHQYVLWAEIKLDDWKKDRLREIKEINPTWVVATDRVRLNNYGQAGALIDQIKVGAPFRLADKRFITNADGTPTSPLTLYVQSITYTYREPTDEDAALNPDVEIVLSDKYEVTATSVAQIAGEVSALSKQLGGSISNIEQVVKSVGDRRYLRKDGLADRSVSPTEFANLLTSYGFRQGMVGGRGWGFYRDNNGAWVLETDRIKARQDFEVNNLVVNQISARGGMVVESAAALEISAVQKLPNGNYRCYFDQKSGTVWNLFRAGDVALCHRFYPSFGTSPAEEDNAESHAAYEKYYKRRVISAFPTYVILDGSDPANYVGSGEPAVGDVIIQFGSYTNENRRYVIIRDVIGGGYERFLGGLDSVRSDGEEYYFVGMQAGMYGDKPRFFLGNADNNIEYIEGKLNVKAELNVQSTIDGKTLDSYMAGVEVSARNHALLTSQEFVWSDFQSGDRTFPYSFEGVNGGDFVTLSFDYDLIDLTYNEGAVIFMQLYMGGKWYYIDHFKLALSNDNGNSTGMHFVGTYQIPADAASVEGKTDRLQLCVDNCAGGTIKIRKLMFQRSKNASEWRPNPNDPNYLYSALRENTTVSGGLVLTSVVEVGNSGSGTYVVRAGMSGIDDETHASGGVAFWAGGTYEQAYNGTSTYAINMDGTGHAAGGTIKFLENKLQVGQYVNLDDDGLDMIVGGNRKMRIGNHNIDATYIMSAVTTRNLGPLTFPAKNGVAGRVYVYINSANAYNLYLDETDAEANWYVPQTKEIGAAPKGARLTFNDIILESNTAYPQYSLGAYYPQLSVKIYNDPDPDSNPLHTKNIDPTWIQHGADYYLGYSLKEFVYTFNSDCAYVEVRFQFIKNNNATPDLSLFTQDTNFAFGTGVDVISTITLPENNVTILGSDGVQMSWGNSNILQQNNFWGARVGSHGISIGAGYGIRIMTDKTNGWVLLDDYIKSVK